MMVKGCLTAINIITPKYKILYFFIFTLKTKKKIFIFYPKAKTKTLKFVPVFFFRFGLWPLSLIFYNLLLKLYNKIKSLFFMQHF